MYYAPGLSVYKLALYAQAAYDDTLPAELACDAVDTAFFSDPVTDTQVHCVITGNYGVAAWRGTKEPRDFLTDADCEVNSDGIHSGIAHAYDILGRTVQHWFREAECDVYSTGHSLGGALALLLDGADVWRVTFGAPCIANGSAMRRLTRGNHGEHYSACTVRYEAIGDPVPLVPPWLDSPGQTIFLHPDGRQEANPGAWSRFRRYWPFAGKLRNPRALLADSLAAHSIAHYVDLLTPQDSAP